jgi:hypothetical protein
MEEKNEDNNGIVTSTSSRGTALGEEKDEDKE